MHLGDEGHVVVFVGGGQQVFGFQGELVGAAHFGVLHHRAGVLQELGV